MKISHKSLYTIFGDEDVINSEKKKSQSLSQYLRPVLI